MNPLKKIDENQRLVIKNFSYLSLMKLFNIGFKIVLVAYLIRVLGENIYGVVTWADSIIQYFILLINYGFNVYAAKYIVDKRGESEKINEIISSIFTIKALLFLLSFVILFLLFQVNDVLSSYNIILSLLLCMGIGEVLFPIWYFQGIEELKIATIIVFISRLLLIGLTLFFVRSENDMLLYVLFIFLSNLAMGVLGVSILIRRFNFSFKLIPFKILKSFLKEAFPFFLGRFLSLVFNSGTIFLIGYFLTMEQVSGFDVALKIVMVFVIPFEMLQQAAFPSLSRTRDKKFLKRLLGYSFALGMVFLCIIYFNANYLLYIFGGEEMTKYTEVLQLLSFLAPVVACTFVLGTCALVAFGYFKEYNNSLIISSVFYLLVLIILYLTNHISFWNLIYLRLIGDVMMVLIRIYYSLKRRVLM